MAGIRDSIFTEAKETGGMFFVIPSIVMLDEALPLSAKVLYGTITWKCGKRSYTWATNRELGDPIDLSAKRVSALLSLLEKRGHVETELEYKDGTHEILRRYIYPIMKSSRDLPGGTPPPKNEDTSPSVHGTLPSETGIPPLENEEINCNIKKDKQDKEDPPIVPPEGNRAPADKPRREKSMPTYNPDAFEIFWAAYPRKDDRRKAIRAWDKLKPDKTLCRVMYAALLRQKESEQWTRDNGRYIPMFPTWINGRRWEDQGVDPSQLPRPQRTGGWADDPELCT